MRKERSRGRGGEGGRGVMKNYDEEKCDWGRERGGREEERTCGKK